MKKKKILDLNGAILTAKEMEKHLEKFASMYNIKSKTEDATYPIPRMMENFYVIEKVYNLLNEHVKLEIGIHPAGEWILDNFYIIEEVVKNIQKELSLKRYKNFVGISNGKYMGFARVYVLAAEIVNHTDNKICLEDLEIYLAAYQTKKILNMDEIWSIGTFMQISIIENIRQICEKIYISQIEKYKVEEIVERFIEKNGNVNFVKKNSYKKLDNMKYPFIEYLSYKLKKYGKKSKPYLEILEEVVEKTGSNVSDVIKKEHFNIAINKISIGNCIKSIKIIQRINFLEIFEKINCVEEILNKDPAHVYEKMDYKTKEYYRQKIKEISKKTKISELYIAKKLLELAKRGKEGTKKQHIGFYLFGKNVQILYRKIGVTPPSILVINKKVNLYILSIFLLTFFIIFFCLKKYFLNIPFAFSIIGGILLLIPISEISIQVIQFILGKLIKPKFIPKIDFSDGIDKQNSTFVVIPTVLDGKEKLDKLIRKLEVYYLANKSENLYFCLLGDATESCRQFEDFDNEIIEYGNLKIQDLNKKYKKSDQNIYNIFNFIYRKRKWNEKQEMYLGWERKRGAIYEFVELLNGNLSNNDIMDKFWVNTINIPDNLDEKDKIKYVITLDGDTDLILNSANELVGCMAHILNKPEVKNGVVKKGYGIIQPRVGVNIDISYKNKFTQIFAGSGGIDSYTNSISDIYQDNFDEGIFTGKGIFDLKIYDEILKNKFPENVVLSHDLLEGCYLRCGLASDVLLMDGYPTKYMSFMNRLSRWIRGDWQIVKWLKDKNLNFLSKYKIFDNLRRSLLEFFVILSGLFFGFLKYVYKIDIANIIMLLTISIIIPFLLEILNLIIIKKDGEEKQITFTPKIGGYFGLFCRSMITLGCLPYKTFISMKSIITSIYRMMFSKRKMLEWVTSEQAEKIVKNDLVSYYKKMYINYILGIFFIIYGIFNFNIFIIFLGVLWCFMPFVMYDISRIDNNDNLKISDKQIEYFTEVAKTTFSYFEDNLIFENNFLIPDNYQKDRKQKYVDRTSSTNIGLSILVVIAGYDLGFISISKALDLLNNIIKTVDSLEKWNGHLYNWYNIKTKKPLYPRYISTVDSGNFIGYMFVLKGFLEDLNLRDNQIVNDLISRVDKIISKTDFSVLYSKSHRLFSIGFNIEENKLTDSYYDLLASEARQTSFIAIAKRDVSSKHWNNLSRTLTILNNKKGLISWSGTSFEYLMPNINIPRYKGSLLDESCRFAIMSQIEYAKKLEIPWGISEAAFNLKDFNLNYQYKAFGIPWLGLKRGLAEELVISPYASILAVLDKPNEVYDNLKILEKYGMFDKYGFYESIDFSNQRLRKNEKSAVVFTYMAHHQALIVLAITNLLKNNIFQKRFMLNPEIEAVSILLQEKMPETFIITKEEKEIPQMQKYIDYENYLEVVYDKLNPNLIRANFISNSEYMVAINQKGEGVSKYGDIYVNRFKITNDYNQGIIFYIKDMENGNILSNCFGDFVARFMPDQNKFEFVGDDIKINIIITIDANEPVEIRRVEIENLSNKDKTYEISVVFEPILSKKEQDYAHPAFNNLFLKFDYNYEKKILEVFRKKREKSEKSVFLMAKFLTDGKQISDDEFEIYLENLDNRGNIGIPNAILNSIPFSNKIGLVVEPIIAMRKTLKVASEEKTSADLILSVNEDKNIALNNLKKYNNSESVKRAFEISKAKADAENRYMEIKGKDIILYQKILSYIFFDNPIRKKQVKKYSNRLYGIHELWKYGISGDNPIILVKIKDVNDAYMIKQILKMYEFFRLKNFDIDIVFLDEEKYSYENYVRAEIESSICDLHLEYMKNVKGGIYVLSKDEINISDYELLNFISDVIIDVAKGDLSYSLDDIEEEYLQNVSYVDDKIFGDKIEEEKCKSNFLENKQKIKYYNGYGAFSADGKEYLITQNKDNRLPTVWCNIMANDKFGTITSENMGGYTWHKNSRLNRMSSWHNRAFLDIPSEIIYMQDQKTGKSWSLGLNPKPDNNDYNVIYGFGYTKYIHNSNDIYQELEVFVPKDDSVKVGILKLINNSMERKKLRIFYYIKPVLGEDEIKFCGDIKVHFDINANVIEAQNLYENEFKSIIYISSSEKIKSFTGDKKFFFGKGGISDPDGLKKYNLNNDKGIGKNACVVMEFELEIESFSTKEVVLTFGAENNIVDLKNMAYKYSKISNCKNELENVKKYWKNILEKIQVYTPSDSLNIILNGWCLYQTLSSRIIGRTGYYQSGGAFGFRDQLQDTLALRYIEPKMVKDQILKHSEHQFVEGDVEHWWHEETSRGIRTRFSDDLLWLPFLVEKYIEVFGDNYILDIQTNYLSGKLLQFGQDEKYDLYPESAQNGTIYEHCIKAIDKSLDFGDNGLPKIGSGDWNDGLNTVGNKGRGESVWLGFFLYYILKRFIQFCNLKGDVVHEKKYIEIMEKLKYNLNLNGWDQKWFKRAFTDDGKILGSIENEECRIDGISQSWSVISGAGEENKKITSMQSLNNHLVDSENGFIKLLDPPFENGNLNPGYIKSYLPGVRENGGQYTHGAIWAIIAETILGHGDQAVKLYEMINPINHSENKEKADKYKVEPFVIPADIYGAGNLIGRGGWTWYTGSSSWYYVAGIEYILGLKIRNNTMFFEPCVNNMWREFSIRYKFEDSIYNIKFYNPDGKNTGVKKVILNGKIVENKIVLDGSGKIFNIEVIM